MAQSSGPISQGTTAERQFTDVQWRDLFGDEPGVVGDMDGSAYAVSLSTSSDVVSVGSSTQRSTARVAGFGHTIPVASPEGITIPAASGTARTDIIALRYDPSYTGLPGPVRLVRIAGTSSGLPVYDSSPPGVEDLPLWSITRQPGQALSQATTARLFPRLVPSLDVPASVPLPSNSPLGTLAQYGKQMFRRELGAASTPVWVRTSGLEGGWTRTFQRSGGVAGGIDAYTNTALLLGGSWTSAPAGDYLVHVTLMLHSQSGNQVGNLAVIAGGRRISDPALRADITSTYAATYSNTFAFDNWAGGTFSTEVSHSVSQGVNVNIHNASSKLVVEYLGAR